MSLHLNANNTYEKVTTVNNWLTDASLRWRLQSTFDYQYWPTVKHFVQHPVESCQWLYRVFDEAKAQNKTSLSSCRDKRQSAHFLSQTVTQADTFLFCCNTNWHLWTWTKNTADCQPLPTTSCKIHISPLTDCFYLCELFCLHPHIWITKGRKMVKRPPAWIQDWFVWFSLSLKAAWQLSGGTAYI